MELLAAVVHVLRCCDRLVVGGSDTAGVLAGVVHVVVGGQLDVVHGLVDVPVSVELAAVVGDLGGFVGVAVDQPALADYDGALAESGEQVGVCVGGAFVGDGHGRGTVARSTLGRVGTLPR